MARTQRSTASGARRKICGALVLVAATWCIGLWTFSRKADDVTAPVSANAAPSTNLVSVAHGTRIHSTRTAIVRAQHKANAQHGARSVSHPSGSYPAGKILESRVTILPPDKSGHHRFRREWLIEPVGGGIPIFFEEQCSGDEKNPKVDNSAAYAANRLLVTIDGKTEFEVFRQELKAKGLTVDDPIMTLRSKGKIAVVHGDKAALGQLAMMEKCVTESNPAAATCRDILMHAEEDGASLARIPNDPCYDELWGMDRIGAPYAWAEQTEATNVIVAVIDTGCN